MNCGTPNSIGVWALLLVVGCGGKVNEPVPDDDTEAETDATETETSAGTSAASPAVRCVPSTRLVQHVCTHTNNGPFTSVAAIGDSEDLPDVSRLHGAFDVSVIAQPVRFQYGASRAGTHIVFTDAEIEWSTIDDSGNLNATTAVAGGSCSGTASGHSFEVDKGQSITLQAETTPARFTLFIEHAATFGDDALVCTSDE